MSNYADLIFQQMQDAQGKSYSEDPWYSSGAKLQSENPDSNQYPAWMNAIANVLQSTAAGAMKGYGIHEANQNYADFAGKAEALNGASPEDQADMVKAEPKLAPYLAAIKARADEQTNELDLDKKKLELERNSKLQGEGVNIGDDGHYSPNQELIDARTAAAAPRNRVLLLQDLAKRGQTIDANGRVVNLPGSVDAAKEQAKAIADAKAGALGVTPEQRAAKYMEQTPEYKNYVASRNLLEGAIKAAQAGDAAGDMTLLDSFLRSNNPGAKATKGFYDSALESRPIGNRIEGALQSATGGGRLTPDDRQSYIARIKANAAEAERNFLAKKQQLEAMAGDRGMSGAHIAPDYTGPQQIVGKPAMENPPPTPPPGYALTGKMDANGNYGIRRVQ